ncbi:MAG: 6-carboxytetrahydropterin synthase [Acidobacteriota bacterium]
MATYTLLVRERFEASHHLRSYRGAPEPVHGHSWRVEAILEADALDDEGMGFDFVEARRHLSELAGRFHHNDINSVPPFDQLSPTTEHLARWFQEELTRRLDRAKVAAVTVWEGPDCAATYRP